MARSEASDLRVPAHQFGAQLVGSVATRRSSLPEELPVPTGTWALQTELLVMAGVLRGFWSRRGLVALLVVAALAGGTLSFVGGGGDPDGDGAGSRAASADLAARPSTAPPPGGAGGSSAPGGKRSVAGHAGPGGKTDTRPASAGRPAPPPSGPESPSSMPGATVPNPVVSLSPAAGGIRGHLYDASLVPLVPLGYVEREYFVSGTARAYGGLTFFGQQFTPDSPNGETAPYTTRIVVRAPADPTRFNGTVLFEWKNVTSNLSLDLDWMTGYREIVRGGYAHVGIDAQLIGVESTKAWDPVRYAGLQHPGDAYAYDIFSQVVQAVRHPAGTDPLDGLGPVRVAIADGHSQSGIFLHAYVDRIQRDARVVDGFLIRGDGNPVFDLEHLDVPVFQFMSETEVAGFTGFANRTGASPPPDSDHYHLWQIAGAAHQDNWENLYLFGQLGRDWAMAPARWDEQTAGRYGEEGNATGMCLYALSTGIGSPEATSIGNLDELPQHYALDAAIAHLRRWIETGEPPPPAPLIETEGTSIVRDRFGNAEGGMRLPPIDVPVASYDGVSGCPLSGATHPLSAATLRALYPTGGAYVAAMEVAVDRAVDAGFLLPYDAEDLLARARAARIPPV